jgi:phosphate starvation-inducible PhoH-like protein
MGNDSKIVVSGDPTQTDLPPKTTSGLKDALQRLISINGIALVRLNQSDIVRHHLVQKIVEAYEARTPPTSDQDGIVTFPIAESQE